MSTEPTGPIPAGPAVDYTDVLIVGAGPVGLTCSILLSRLGIAHRVIERRSGLHQAPQAHVVSSRTMEIFRAAGIDEAALRERATRVEDLASVQWVHTLAGPELGRFTLVTPEGAAKIFAATPTPLANISQHELEPVLFDHAAAAGGTVDFDREWRSCSSSGEGVASRILNRATGSEETLRSRFLLGCDGAASPVRHALGIEMKGPRQIQTFLNVFFEADLRRIVGDRPAILYWHMDPEEPGVFIAHDIDSTWVFMHPYDPSRRSAEDFSEDVCRDLVARALGTECSFTIRSVDTWVMTAQVAERYGERAMFLLGDAAHRFPPTGGLGMNTGVADAFNLVWKLSAVLDGRAGPSLLETYEVERRAVARRNCEQSLANYAKMREVEDALGLRDGLAPDQVRQRIRGLPDDPSRREHVQAAIDRQAEHFDMLGLDLGQCYESGALVPDETQAPQAAISVSDYHPTNRPGARLPHAWLERGGVALSSLDLVDPRLPVLLTGVRGKPWCDAARDAGLPAYTIGEGGDVADPHGGWVALSEISPTGSLLVRPDSHVGWRSHGAVDDPRGTLDDALQHIYSPPRRA